MTIEVMKELLKSLPKRSGFGHDRKLDMLQSSNKNFMSTPPADQRLFHMSPQTGYRQTALELLSRCHPIVYCIV